MQVGWSIGRPHKRRHLTAWTAFRGLLSLVINFRYKKKEQATKDEDDFWHVGNHENAADLVKELGDDGDQEAGQAAQRARQLAHL